jgi:hypothetical protein
MTGAAAAITIDPEFRSYIPALSAEELDQLEQNIAAEGCLDPLVLWGDVLIDGHNRYEICTRLGIRFDTVQRFFPHRDAALDWMDAHQLGRRNLSPDARRLLLGRRYNRLKRSPTDNLVQNSPKDQNDPSGESTASLIAKQHGVSAATVKRAGRFAEEVEGDPEIKAAVEAGQPVAEVRRARAEALGPDSPAEPSLKVERPARALRKGLIGLTRDALEDEVAELRSALAEQKVKTRQTERAAKGLKELVADLSADDKGKVIAAQAKKIEYWQSEKFRVEEKSASFSRQAYAAKKEAERLRENASVVEKFEAGDPDIVAKVREQIMDAVAGSKGKSTRANPDYEPSEAWDAATAVSDCANEIADTVDKHGGRILEALPDNLARARAIAKLLRGRDAINLILGDAA